MQLRRALPLTLAALAVATGCVTVHPAAPPDAPRLMPAASRTEPRLPSVPAWPLGYLPEAAASTPGTAEVQETREPAPADPVPAAAPEPPRRAAGPVRRYRTYKPYKPVRPARPAHPAKPLKRPPAKAKSRPAQQRTYDMTSLCEAARGTVSPSIVALCR
ncbi:hypothetical protein [Streptomyces sp. NPDC002587]